MRLKNTGKGNCGLFKEVKGSFFVGRFPFRILWKEIGLKNHDLATFLAGS